MQEQAAPLPVLDSSYDNTTSSLSIFPGVVDFPSRPTSSTSHLVSNSSLLRFLFELALYTAHFDLVHGFSDFTRHNLVSTS